MDESALAKELLSKLNSLEVAWSSLDACLNLWTTLVVIGVAVELIVLIVEFRHDWKDFRRGIIHSPERPSTAIFGFGFLGAALVAIGVAGELRIHMKAGKVETEMRDTTRQLVSITDAEAKAAELETAQLYALTAPRRLTLEQQREIGTACKRFAGQLVTLASYPIESESSALVEQLVVALRSGNVNAMRIFSAPLFSGKPLSGFRVEGTNQPLVSILRTTLQEVGHLTMADPTERIVPEGAAVIGFGTLIPPNLGVPQAHIFVGVKPIPLLPIPASAR